MFETHRRNNDRRDASSSLLARPENQKAFNQADIFLTRGEKMDKLTHMGTRHWLAAAWPLLPIESRSSWKSKVFRSNPKYFAVFSTWRHLERDQLVNDIRK